MVTQDPVRHTKRGSAAGDESDAIQERAVANLRQSENSSEKLYGQLILLAIFALAAALRLLKRI